MVKETPMPERRSHGRSMGSAPAESFPARLEPELRQLDAGPPRKDGRRRRSCARRFAASRKLLSGLHGPTSGGHGRLTAPTINTSAMRVGRSDCHHERVVVHWPPRIDVPMAEFLATIDRVVRRFGHRVDSRTTIVGIETDAGRFVLKHARDDEAVRWLESAIRFHAAVSHPSIPPIVGRRQLASLDALAVGSPNPET